MSSETVSIPNTVILFYSTRNTSLGKCSYICIYVAATSVQIGNFLLSRIRLIYLNGSLASHLKSNINALQPQQHLKY